MPNLDPIKKAMPVLVADQYFLALERLGTRWAMPGSGRDEWELLSGATARLTSLPGSGMNALTYKTEPGRQDWPACPLVSLVRNLGQSNSCPAGSGLAAADITSERFHNFGASAPGPNPQKTGSRTFLGNEQSKRQPSSR